MNIGVHQNKIYHQHKIEEAITRFSEYFLTKDPQKIKPKHQHFYASGQTLLPTQNNIKFVVRNCVDPSFKDYIDKNKYFHLCKIDF